MLNPVWLIRLGDPVTFEGKAGAEQRRALRDIFRDVFFDFAQIDTNTNLGENCQRASARGGH